MNYVRLTNRGRYLILSLSDGEAITMQAVTWNQLRQAVAPLGILRVLRGRMRSSLYETLREDLEARILPQQPRSQP